MCLPDLSLYAHRSVAAIVRVRCAGGGGDIVEVGGGSEQSYHEYAIGVSSYHFVVICGDVIEVVVAEEEKFWSR
jgi:hypothetical protein